MCGRDKATIVPESVTSSTLDGSEFGSLQLPLFYWDLRLILCRVLSFVLLPKHVPSCQGCQAAQAAQAVPGERRHLNKLHKAEKFNAIQP